MRTVAIIQARTGSTRLPGKVLADLAGQPLLSLVIERTRAATGLDAVAVATSDLERDDAVAAVAAEAGVDVVRGSEQDVLDRYHTGAEQLDADLILRVTADCPLVDPELVDRLLELRNAGDFDHAGVATAWLPPSVGRRYPDGLDCEVFTRAVLERTWREATEPYDREHVAPFMVRDARVRRGVLEAEEDHGDERWTVDYPEDLEFVRAVVQRLGRRCGYRDIFALLDREPELRELNAGLV